MKFYLTETNHLRRVSADGSMVQWLLDDGGWSQSNKTLGYDLAKIERPTTVPLVAPEEAIIAPWSGPGDNSSITPEAYMARRAGRNL